MSGRYLRIGFPSIVLVAVWVLVASLGVRSGPICSAQEPDSTAVNLAAAANGGRIVSATDEYDEYPASNLIDGDKLDNGEWWSHENPTYPQTIVFALGTQQPKAIDKVVLNPWTSEWRFGWVKDFEVYVSATSSHIDDMERVGSYTLEHVGIDQAFTFDPVPAKYVGLVVQSNYGSAEGVGLTEFEVYEVPAQALGDDGVAPSDPNNLAAASNGGRIVAFSDSDENGKWPVERLIDGRTDTATGWSSGPDLETSQYVVFGFKGTAPRVVDRVVLNAYSANYEDDWIKDFELRGSETARYIDQMASLGKFRLNQNGEDQAFTFPPVSLRYVALVPLSNYGGTAYGLNEFEVYRATSGADDTAAGAKPATLPLDGTPVATLDVSCVAVDKPGSGAKPTPGPSPSPEEVAATPTKAPEGATVDNINADVTYNDLVPVVYHLYGAYFDDLAKIKLTNHNRQAVSVRTEVRVKGYTEADVKTTIVGSGETITVAQNPPLVPAGFGLLAENRVATLSTRVEYLKEGEPKLIFEDTSPLTVYARGNFPWNIPGFHNGTIFLAAMVTPNDPAVVNLLREAADYTPDGTIVHGYNTEDDADHEVWDRMKAVYEAVASHKVTYVAAGVDFVPKAEEDHGFTMQRLKWPREVLESRSGMCVETSLLFASAFEAIGLRPIMVTLPGHVFVGVPISWDSSTFYFLETTMVGRFSFEDAVQRANKEFADVKGVLESDQLDEYFWLDVAEVREEGLVPMPWRLE